MTVPGRVRRRLRARGRSFLAGATGATAIEYAVIAALVGGIAIPGYRMLGAALEKTLLVRLGAMQGREVLFVTEERRSGLMVEPGSAGRPEDGPAVEGIQVEAPVGAGSAVRSGSRLDSATRAQGRR